MAQHAFVYDWMSLAPQGNGNLTMTCTVLYWDENGTTTTFTSDPITVPVTVTPSANASQISTAVMTAVKDMATTKFGWTMATNSVIGPAFNRN